MRFSDFEGGGGNPAVDTAVTSAAKWARGLSVSRSVRLVTYGDRSLTHRVDRDVTDARLSA